MDGAAYGISWVRGCWRGGLDVLYPALHVVRCAFGMDAGIHPFELFLDGNATSDLCLDLLAMIPEVGEGGEDVGSGDRGKVLDDIIDRLSLIVEPHYDVLDANAAACDDGLRATGVCDDCDVWTNCVNEHGNLCFGGVFRTGAHDPNGI